MDSQPVRILYMEDDPGQARLLQKRLEREGYIVSIARDGGEGLAMYDPAVFDVVIVDQIMPVYDGLDVIRRLAAQGPLPPIIMITGAGNEKIAVEALKIGAYDYIVKDPEGGYFDLLPVVIEQVLAKHHWAEEKRRAEEALRQYAAELQARNDELDAFAHTVAHDLKNPLGMLIFILSEYDDSLSPEERAGYLAEMMRVARKMNNIIEELLLLAEVRKAEIETAPLDMAGIVAEALARLDDMITEAQAEVIVPSRWPNARGYAPWVEEVWVNYINNAIKYGGQPPRVELGAEVQPDGMVRFWVRDNGCGIAPEARARLFTPFTRLDQVRTEGHGLGLSIVRRIIDKLDGQVGVESQVGQGSVFFFTLPRAAQ